MVRIAGSSTFDVYRSTTPGNPDAERIATGITTTSFTDSLPVVGTMYYYRVAAVTAMGVQSPPTAEVSAGLLQVSIVVAAIREGDSGASQAVLTVMLSWSSPGLVTVDYNTADATATLADNDYLAASGTLAFLPGESTKTIAVTVIGDAKVESDETFLVNLSNAVGATIVDGAGIARILDDEVPRAAWSTCLGGGNVEIGFGIAVDNSDNVLVAGRTGSPGWTSGELGTSYNGDDDGFVAKLDPSGEPVWSRYLGGSSTDLCFDVAVDGVGNVLVTGYTLSHGWTSSGYDTSYNGGYDDAFVAKLTPSGELLWSTYLGGSEEDAGFDIAVDSLGNVLVAGWTTSPGWTSGGFDTSYNGAYDAFVSKLSPSGELLCSTYVGGSDKDYAYGIAVDSYGNVLITGETFSSGWTSSGFDTNYNGGDYDIFLAKLDPSGTLVWSSYMGGSGNDYGDAIAVDSADNVFVTGLTGSPGWTSRGVDTSYNGGEYDAFVAKVTPSGSEIVWSSYLGGDSADYAMGIAVDRVGSVLVTGYTSSAEGFDTGYNGGDDGFVAKLSPSGESLWSTYVGGPDRDYATRVAVDSLGHALLTGETKSSGWTSGGGAGCDGSRDAFVAKMSGGGNVIVAAGNMVVTISQSQDLAGMRISDHARVEVEPGVQAVVCIEELAISGEGTLDINDNEVRIRGSSIVAITALIQSAYHEGSWAGVGITSSTAKNDAGGMTRLGARLNDQGEILIRCISNGDANLDGVVNGDDYFQVDCGFISQNAGWFNGDFNYDGLVNAADFFLIDSAFIGDMPSEPVAGASDSPAALPIHIVPLAEEIVAERPAGNSSGVVAVMLRPGAAISVPGVDVWAVALVPRTREAVGALGSDELVVHDTEMRKFLLLFSQQRILG